MVWLVSREIKAPRVLLDPTEIHRQTLVVLA